AVLRLRRFESCSPHNYGAITRKPLYHKGDRHQAGVAQLVEHQPSKLNVAGSNLVSRSTGPPLKCKGGRPIKNHNGLCSSEVEHFLGKEEVAGSIPAKGSRPSGQR